MNETHEVISAFLDDESFDSGQLAEALSDQAGRDLLIDLIALRHLAQPDDKEPHTLRDQKPWRASLRVMLAAAAVLVALVGGYLVGERRSETGLPEAPAATRVVDAPPAWQELSPARTR
jgi:negative regulator of sigma E activity